MRDTMGLLTKRLFRVFEIKRINQISPFLIHFLYWRVIWHPAVIEEGFVKKRQCSFVLSSCGHIVGDFLLGQAFPISAMI